jgi:hypothetical protein
MKRCIHGWPYGEHCQIPEQGTSPIGHLTRPERQR